MISFALDFFCFGSTGFNFVLPMGLRCVRFPGADALLKRRKSGKYKKYLCKLENTEKSIWFSVKPNFKSDIQNIFNRLLHFHARQMDQRLGFSVTESVLISNFGEWEPFFLDLKNTCTWCAWEWRILGEWCIVSRPCCSYAILYFSTILISIRTWDQDKRDFYQNKANPRPRTQLKDRLLTEQLKNGLLEATVFGPLLPPRNSSFCYFDSVCKICISFSANLLNTPLAFSLFIRLPFYLT